MEFKSLITIKRRLVFEDLQGLFDLACPVAWLPSKDADILQAHTVACVGDVLKEGRLFVAPRVLLESGSHLASGLTYIGVLTGTAGYVVYYPTLVLDGGGVFGPNKEGAEGVHWLVVDVNSMVLENPLELF